MEVPCSGDISQIPPRNRLQRAYQIYAGLQEADKARRRRKGKYGHPHLLEGRQARRSGEHLRLDRRCVVLQRQVPGRIVQKRARRRQESQGRDYHRRQRRQN